MKRFTTETGSIYEVDEAGKRIRRVTGAVLPTVRIGEGWKAYEEISDITVGLEVIIRWPDSVPLLEGSPTGATPTTWTSRVTG